MDAVATVFQLLQMFHRRMEIEIRPVLQFLIEPAQNNVIDVCSEVPHGSVQKLKLILDAELLEFCSGCGVHLCPLSAVGKVDLIHIVHQTDRLSFPDVFIQGSAEIVGDVVFPVREGACAAETVHDGTGLASDTGFGFPLGDGTAAFGKRAACLKYGDFQIRTEADQLIGGKDAARARSDNNHVVIHASTSFSYSVLYSFAKARLCGRLYLS